MSDFPDFTKGIVRFSSAGGVTNTDFPDWTDGVVVLTSPLAPPGDLPDWTKAITEVAGASPSPPITATLYAQYDASQISGVADGATLSDWPDLSGNGLDLTQNNAANQPVFYSSTSGKLINGRPAVFFNGTHNTIDNWVQNTAFTTSTTWTLFAVAQCFHFSGFHFQTVCGDNHSPTFLSFGYDTVNHDYQVDNQTGLVTGGTPDGNPHVLAVVNNGASSIITVDGTQVGTGTLSATAIGTTFLVGTDNSHSNGSFNGLIGEVLVYNGTMSSSDQASTVSYLRGRWGI